MDTVNYMPERRLVAFMDILGFREQTKRCLDDSSLLEALDRALRATDYLVKPYLGFTTDTRMFSDCICSSSPFEPNNVFKFIYTLEAVQMNLVANGVFVRGGIAVGRHFESPRMILSEGLSEAYLLESSTAIFPRIVATEETVRVIAEAAAQATEPDNWDGGPMSLKEALSRHFRRDVDGTLFLSYLMSLHRIDRSAIVMEYIDSHKEAVQRWIADGRESGAPERVRLKHEWARNYHNVMIAEFFRLDDFEGDEFILD